MGFKMPGAPMIANTKSHGTNANYKKSGLTNIDGSPGGPPFLGKLGKGIGKIAGNFIKGKGAFGLLNPMGAIASRAGLFNKNKQNTTNTIPQPTQPTQQTQPVNTQTPVEPAVPHNTAPMGSEGMDPNAPNPEELGMQ